MMFKRLAFFVLLVYKSCTRRFANYKGYHLLSRNSLLTRTKVLTHYYQGVQGSGLPCTPWLVILYTIINYGVHPENTKS